MKALVYHGPGQRSWEDKPDPQIQAPTDIIVRIDTTTICGTDLHILKGDVPEVKPGTILGHEGVGTVLEVGDNVATVKPGDLRNCRVQQLTSDGAHLASFGAPGDGDGSLDRPAGVGVDSVGNVYVSDFGRDRVQVYRPDDVFFPGQEGGFRASELLDAAREIQLLPNVRIAGVTTFPVLSYDFTGVQETASVKAISGVTVA